MESTIVSNFLYFSVWNLWLAIFVIIGQAVQWLSGLSSLCKHKLTNVQNSEILTGMQEVNKTTDHKTKSPSSISTKSNNNNEKYLVLDREMGEGSSNKSVKG